MDSKKLQHSQTFAKDRLLPQDTAGAQHLLRNMK
jgi:hypothetical protein